MTHKNNNNTIARFEDGSSRPPDRYLLLTKSGELELIRNDNENFNSHQPDVCFKDSYLFETLEDIYWQPAASNLCAHLHPPTSEEMAFFMVQRYIIPVMRDLEIIQCGVEQALTNSSVTKPRVSKAVGAMFDALFYDLEKARGRIYRSVEADKRDAPPAQNLYDAVMVS